LSRHGEAGVGFGARLFNARTTGQGAAAPTANLSGKSCRPAVSAGDRRRRSERGIQKIHFKTAI